MASLLLRNLFFTILQPGIVAGLIPYLIVQNEIEEAVSGSITLIQWIGLFFIMTGVFILLTSVFLFAAYGRGTLSPVDPTKKLVVVGFYKYTRNPMYLAVMLLLLGETIFMQSGDLLIYMVFIGLAFYLFVVYYEEPKLEKQFGNDYLDYRRKVSRWL